VYCPVFTAGDLTTVVSFQAFAAGDQTPVWEDLVLVQNNGIKCRILFKQRGVLALVPVQNYELKCRILNHEV
jgi:hypothetical protein